MTTRLDRKNRNYADIGTLSKGGIFDLFDNIIKEAFRINDIEYDYICEHASDEELDLISKEVLTFSEKRQCVTILSKYLTDFEI